MATKQFEFLEVFRRSFASRFDRHVEWIGGQVQGNTAEFAHKRGYRRGGNVRVNEAVELGDLRADLGRHCLIVEYESGGMVVQNLLKYWPYLCGDLVAKPTKPIILVHFSDWSSYGSFRDLWCWTLDKMRQDPGRLVDLHADQFDHGGGDLAVQSAAVVQSLDFLAPVVKA